MFDRVMGIFRVAATSISKNTHEVLETLDGGGVKGDPGQWPEQAIGQIVYGAIGLIVRARRPTKDSKGQEQRVEGLAAKLGDALLRFAGRDTRLNGFYPNPREGDVALVGYAGAFDSNSPRFDADGNPAGTERVTYVPYAFVDGVPTKAMTIEVLGVDGEESISIIHGDGMAVLMKAGGKNSVVVKNKAGDAYVEVNDDGCTLNGNVVINGGATIGSPVGALPAAIAPKLAAYIAQLETDIAAALTAVGAGSAAAGAAGASAFTGGAAARAPLVAAIAATKTSVA
jgi:hypothetical protein